ncbi:MAG: ATP-binding protein [Candidatus Paceibacterota bacterium]
MNIFNKPFAEISEYDINELIEEAYPEDLHLEYKKKLSADTWQANQKGVATKSKQKLAEEIIAFANADGGLLLVGIEESKTLPPRADKIFLIPKVNELADRVRRSLYDLVEPKIPNLMVKGVQIDNDSGVLVIKVEKSYQAPHRALFNKECYARRNDEKIPMTMREIKDLTLKSVNVYETLQDRLEEQASNFKTNFINCAVPFNFNIESKEKIGIRFTVVSISDDVIFPKIYRKVRTYDSDGTLKVKVNDQTKEISTPVGVHNKRTILRGALLYGQQLNIVIKENGLIEYTLVYDRIYKGKLFVHGSILLGYFFKAIHLLEKIKEYYNHFDNEFVVEVEILTTKDEISIVPFGVTETSFGQPTLNQSKINFPRYTYQSKDELDSLLNLFNEDIANLSGQDIYSEMELLRESFDN